MENTINGILQVEEKQVNLIFTSRKKKKENKAKKKKQKIMKNILFELVR